jgi:hypothetical protein
VHVVRTGLVFYEVSNDIIIADERVRLRNVQSRTGTMDRWRRTKTLGLLVPKNISKTETTATSRKATILNITIYTIVCF